MNKYSGSGPSIQTSQHKYLPVASNGVTSMCFQKISLPKSPYVSGSVRTCEIDLRTTSSATSAVRQFNLRRSTCSLSFSKVPHGRSIKSDPLTRTSLQRRQWRPVPKAPLHLIGRNFSSHVRAVSHCSPHFSRVVTTSICFFARPHDPAKALRKTLAQLVLERGGDLAAISVQDLIDSAEDGATKSDDDLPSDEPKERTFSPVELQQMRFDMANSLKYVIILGRLPSVSLSNKSIHF